MARLQAQHAELQQRQTLAAFELTDGELEAVLAAMRADVQSEEVAVARRALSLFIRAVDAERLVIWYHEPALVENARLQCVPPRGFRLKTSMTRGQQYWPEVWAMAAAWREQLGDGEAGSARVGRGRAAQVGPVVWGEGEVRGWAAVKMAD